jgi:uncharacterized membrane protein
MAFCAKCGAQLNAGSGFCAACGTAISGQNVATTSGAAAAPAQSSAGAPSAGMTNNVAGALSYITIVGIIFLLTEPYKSNRFVRFHAFQSIFFAVAWIAVWIGWVILSGILAMVTRGGSMLLTFPLSILISLGFFGCWVLLLIKAYGNQEFKLPIIGDLAAKQAGS